MINEESSRRSSIPSKNVTLNEILEVEENKEKEITG